MSKKKSNMKRCSVTRKILFRIQWDITVVPEEWLKLNGPSKQKFDNIKCWQECSPIEALSYSCCCCVSSVVSDSVRPHGLQPTRLLRPWDSPGKNTGVGCHPVGIFTKFKVMPTSHMVLVVILRWGRRD